MRYRTLLLIPMRLLPLLIFPLTIAACGSSRAIPVPTATPRAVSASLLPPLPHSYAALGASETFGTGAVPHTRGYAYLLAKALRARTFVDTAIPGAPLPSAYETELTNALTARPALCTVFFGFNDLRTGVTRAVFLEDLRDLSATLRRAGARVLIIGLPDLSIFPAVASFHLPGVRTTILSWNAGMKAVAHQTGAQYMDLTRFDTQLRAHPEYLSSDGLHPSNRGYARLAHYVLQTIRHDRLWR
jgi:acyl-CoA thioesterase I